MTREELKEQINEEQKLSFYMGARSTILFGTLIAITPLTIINFWTTIAMGLLGLFLAFCRA